MCLMWDAANIAVQLHIGKRWEDFRIEDFSASSWK